MRTAEHATLDEDNLYYRALADPIRRHLLRILDDVAAPMHPDQLASRVGLHVNTIRGHLKLLERAKLVERTTIHHETAGRPRVLFRSVPHDARSPTAGGYRLLAEILASSIQATSDEPRRTALEAGRVWGHFITNRPAPTTVVNPAQIVDEVVATLADLGFEPESRPHGSTTEILLHDCPYREIARTRGDVVCAVHEGLMRGMVEAMGHGASVDALEPFVEASLCVARISAR
jgi:predicted ArsR family transcriptional regulator